MRRISARLSMLFLFIYILSLSFTQRGIVFAGGSQDAPPYVVTTTGDFSKPTSLSPMPTPPILNGNTTTVHIKFTGLVHSTAYDVCLDADSAADCLNTMTPLPGNANSDGSGNLTVDVCADGKNTLKLVDNYPNNHECGNDDYFWEQHTYRLGLFRHGNVRDQIHNVPIYISHYYPRVDVSPSNPTPNSNITVTITGTRRPHDNGTRNNYRVEIHNQHVMLEKICGTVKPGKPYVFKFNPYEVGDYVIQVHEQNDESWKDCGGGFDYYQIPVHIAVNGGSVGPIKADPNETDLPRIEETLPSPPLPCLTPSGNGGCKTVATAIGDINTQPAGFIKSVFGIILSLAGGIALLLIIISGYKLMASQGNPEAVQGAREQLTSAVVGLLFIIFSLVILQIIGVDILRIPGFGG